MKRKVGTVTLEGCLVHARYSFHDFRDQESQNGVLCYKVSEVFPTKCPVFLEVSILVHNSETNMDC